MLCLSTECCVTEALLPRFGVVAIRKIPFADDDYLENCTLRVVAWRQLAVTKSSEKSC